MSLKTIEERASADGFDGIEPIAFYQGRDAYGEFSNFSRHAVVLPHPFTGKMQRYETGEHRFQAMKATTREDHDHVAQLYDEGPLRPSVSKDRGRAILLRDGWGSNYGDLCWYVMVELVCAKAMQHRLVMLALKASVGRPIYEDSPTDDIWGVRSSPVAFDGKNLLGRSWMRARTLLVPS